MQNLDSVVNDIIVIGAGGCGLMAALVAAKKGAQVLLLEKTDKPGGGTAFSSKGIRAAGSRASARRKSRTVRSCMRRIYCVGTTTRAMPS